MFDELIASRRARVAVMGLGYAGLPLALTIAEAGFSVLGFDTDREKIAALQRNESYIRHVSDERLRMARNGGFTPWKEGCSALEVCDVAIICVPTPLTPNREPDLSYVVSTAETLAQYPRMDGKPRLVVLESTTYPGTTDEVIRPILERAGQRVGVDFHLAFSPEREDPNNHTWTTKNIPKLVGGVTPECGRIAALFYGSVVDRVVPVSSAAVAEAAKILENTYRAVNIALVNELKVLFERMGLNIWEIIDAAATKPFGFTPFYPGPGLGGHCLVGSETVRVRNGAFNTVLPLAELFDRLAPAPFRIGDVEVIEPHGLEALSIDPTGAPTWRTVGQLFRRPFRGTFIDIKFTGNQSLRTTDRHPMLIVENDRIAVREARDLRVGDQVPRLGALPDSVAEHPTIDMLAELSDQVIDKLHVRIKGTPWRHYRAMLRERYGASAYDAIRNDTLAARRYLEIEPQLGVQRHQLILRCGKGNSQTSFPAVLVITPDFCRLLGYYISEGCITTEKGRPRVRLTFNRNETEYMDDVRVLLGELGLRASAHDDHICRATTLRAGNQIFGYLLRDILNAGVDSYDVRIPDIVMGASAQHHEQVLIGLFRGDGSVSVRTGRRAYQKNGRQYCHQDNAGNAGYFSSSPELIMQVEHLLQGLGFHPSRRRRGYLSLSDPEGIARLGEMFGGEKAERIKRLTVARHRATAMKKVRFWSGGCTLGVKSIETTFGSEMVYSLEVPGAHTFATSGGVFVHNCVPVDPFYLTWRARQFDMETRFIELAGAVNVEMPDYVIERLTDALNDRGQTVNGARVLILGVAYRRDVDDDRESPAYKLIDILRRKHAVVSYHDPFIPTLDRPGRRHNVAGLDSVELTPEVLAATDAVLIVTDHTAVDYEMVVRCAPLVVDTRNVVATIPSEPRAVIVRA